MAVDVEVHESLGLSKIEEAWDRYREAFEEINADSVQRHMMTRHEFIDVMLDDQVLKFIAQDSETKEFRGMSVMTNNLRHWPLISSSYFAKHFPEDFKANRIWYVGFIFSINFSGGTRELLTYKSLVVRMYPYVLNSGGFSVEDYGHMNLARRRMPHAAAAVLRSLNENHTHVKLDEQSYWAHFFDGKVRQEYIF